MRKSKFYQLLLTVQAMRRLSQGTQ